MMAGVVFIYSASFRTSEEFATRQLLWMLVGFACLFLTVRLGYRFFLGVSYAGYLLALMLLVWVDLGGVTRLGAQRWIEIGPFSFQPSEFAKLATILALANFLGSRDLWEGEGRVIAATAAAVGIPFFLIVKQPDLGTAALMIPLGVVPLFLWGVRYRYVISTFLTGLLVSPLGWNLLKDYQKKRILVFLNPNLDPLGSGYTAIQSKIAVGSGGLFGKGWLHGTQSQLDFVPEHHTDFIFSVIAEELGFAGSFFLIVLYGTLFYQIFQVIEKTTDLKGKLLGVGILSIFFFQVLVNIGMSFGLFPITGITLPLISYGGSSLLANSIALGLLVSVYKERSIF
jgi:rod shape determining protein RodA